MTISSASPSNTSGIEGVDENKTVQAVDIHLSDIDEERYIKEKSDYDLYLYNGGFVDSLYPDRDACVKIYKYIKILFTY